MTVRRNIVWSLGALIIYALLVFLGTLLFLVKPAGAQELLPGQKPKREARMAWTSSRPALPPDEAARVFAQSHPPIFFVAVNDEPLLIVRGDAKHGPFGRLKSTPIAPLSRGPQVFGAPILWPPLIIEEVRREGPHRGIQHQNPGRDGRSAGRAGTRAGVPRPGHQDRQRR